MSQLPIRHPKVRVCVRRVGLPDEEDKGKQTIVFCHEVYKYRIKRHHLPNLPSPATLRWLHDKDHQV